MICKSCWDSRGRIGKLAAHIIEEFHEAGQKGDLAIAEFIENAELPLDFRSPPNNRRSV
jgi:hypothetical protein